MNSTPSATGTLRMLNEKQAAELLGVSVALLRKHRTKRVGVPFSRIGRRVVYQFQDVADYIASSKVGGAK